MEEITIIAALQAIHARVQEKVRYVLGPEHHVTSIAQNTSTRYVLAPGSLKEGSPRYLQTYVTATYSVECEVISLVIPVPRKRLFLDLLSDGSLRVREVTECFP